MLCNIIVRVFQLCILLCPRAINGSWFRQMFGPSYNIFVFRVLGVMNANAVCAVHFPLSAYISYHQDRF